MKIAIINVFGSRNRGDALLLEALHASVRETFGAQALIAGVAQFPETERDQFPDVTWTPSPGRDYSKNGLVKKVRTALRLAGAYVFARLGAPEAWPLLSPPRAQQQSVRAIRDADLVISCAGGFLLGQNLSLLGNLLQLYIATLYRRRTILAPQTIGPIEQGWLRELCRKVLERTTLICAREQFTYDYLTQVLRIAPDKIVRTTDIAFEHKDLDPEGGLAALQAIGVGADEKFIGTTIVDWYFPFSTDAGSAKDQYYDRIVDALRRLSDTSGRRIVIFNQVSTDLALSKRVCAALEGRAVLDTSDRTPAIMRGMISRADMFLGSRFHSCVFALLSRVPTFALAYSYKSTGIMEDLGLDDRVIDIQALEVDQIVSTGLAMMNNRQSEVDRINRALETTAFPRFSSILRSFSDRAGA